METLLDDPRCQTGAGRNHGTQLHLSRQARGSDRQRQNGMLNLAGGRGGHCETLQTHHPAGIPRRSDVRQVLDGILRRFSCSTMRTRSCEKYVGKVKAARRICHGARTCSRVRPRSSRPNCSHTPRGLLRAIQLDARGCTQLDVRTRPLENPQRAERVPSGDPSANTLHERALALQRQGRDGRMRPVIRPYLRPMSVESCSDRGGP
jgi:hypothetical protein